MLCTSTRTALVRAHTYAPVVRRFVFPYPEDLPPALVRAHTYAPTVRRFVFPLVLVLLLVLR